MPSICRAGSEALPRAAAAQPKIQMTSAANVSGCIMILLLMMKIRMAVATQKLLQAIMGGAN
jgi:hypothetical protein